jgi:hypothetical protein
VTHQLHGQIHYGATIYVTDGTGVPILEHQVQHHVPPGASLSIPLPAVTAEQGRNELLAGILLRLLNDGDSYKAIERGAPGRGATLDLDGTVTLTPREMRWLTTHYPDLETRE